MGRGSGGGGVRKGQCVIMHCLHFSEWSPSPNYSSSIHSPFWLTACCHTMQVILSLLYDPDLAILRIVDLILSTGLSCPIERSTTRHSHLKIKCIKKGWPRYFFSLQMGGRGKDTNRRKLLEDRCYPNVRIVNVSLNALNCHTHSQKCLSMYSLITKVYTSLTVL